MSLAHFQIEFDKMRNHDRLMDRIHPIQDEAFSKFLDKGFPTNNWEDWRFTNLSSITKGKFRISELQDSPQSKLDIKPYKIENVNTIVIYNGHFQETLSTIPNGIQLLTNLEYFKKNQGANETTKESPFDLLNTAFMDCGMSLKVNPNTVVETPVRILFISKSKDSIMVNPRIYLDVDDSASVTFIEHHVGDATSYLQNISLFVSIGVNASLNHIRIQSNSTSTQSIANLDVQQETDSHYTFMQFADGSALGRTDTYVDLNGKGSTCELFGLALSNGKQHLDNHIIIDHKVPHCTSSQLFKSVLQEKSSGVFNGRTIVQQNAIKTDAKQSNKNLLLSKDALMNSNPQLEIHADDVRCSHGSTTGELDTDVLFYLRSRGLDLETAKSLLVRGFATECFDTVKDKNVKSFIIDCFNKWLGEIDKL